MKKSTLLFILLTLIFIQTKAQQSPDKPSPYCETNLELSGPKSIIWQWDTLVTYDTVDRQTRLSQTFYPNGDLMTRQYEYWALSTWVISDPSTDTYDALGNVFVCLGETLDSNAVWENIFRS